MNKSKRYRKNPDTNCIYMTNSVAKFVLKTTKIRYVTTFENWEHFSVFHVVGSLIKWEENF
jgi:hypothetical protein